MVLLLCLLDVLFVPQRLHMLQLLVGKLQLLLVVAVLLHLGLKVPQLLLSEQEKEGKRAEGCKFSSPSITCTTAQGQLICITEKRLAECFPTDTSYFEARYL